MATPTPAVSTTRPQVPPMACPPDAPSIPNPFGDVTIWDMFANEDVFIRTITQYYTGRLVGITKEGFLVLAYATWIEITGRFGTMLAGGQEHIQESEPYPPGELIPVQLGAVIDIARWFHPLPREQISRKSN